MKPSRRFFLPRLLATLGALACFGMPTAASAQAWPTKPVRVIVPFPAGTAPDVVARLLGEKLSTLWGQALVIDNKPGAGGIPGMSALAHSPNVGYTLGFVPAAVATITPLAYKNPQFNIDDDFVPVVTVGTSPLLLVTQSSNGIKTLTDLEKQAKANPGKYNFAAPQPNSLPHLAGELVGKMGQMGLYTVPYQGSPAAVTAVISGDAVLTLDGLPGLLQHIKSGRLRALAVTSAKRLPGFDDIPTVAETYPGYEVIGWFSVFAPTGTPAAVVEKVNHDVQTVMQNPELVARLADMGIYPAPGNVAAAKAFFQTQRAVMKRIAATLGVQPQ